MNNDGEVGGLLFLTFFVTYHISLSLSLLVMCEKAITFQCSVAGLRLKQSIMCACIDGYSTQWQLMQYVAWSITVVDGPRHPFHVVIWKDLYIHGSCGCDC